MIFPLAFPRKRRYANRIGSCALRWNNGPAMVLKMLKIMKRNNVPVTAALAGLLLLALAACSDQPKRPKQMPVSLQDLHLKPSIYPALRGTIRSVAALAYARPILVRGWGVVAGLPNTGSGEMPPGIRSILSDRLLKNGAGYLSRGTEQYDPNRILNSRQVAAVFVQGAIPAMATAGTHFDLYVTALAGTATTNLENGLLWPVPLRTHIRKIVQTDAIARGMGPVFCNPFNAGGSLKKPADIIRNGRILGGGVVTNSLPVMLELYSPSYRISALVEQIINERFGGYPPIATAENDMMIRLRVPKKYRHHPARFVRRVMALYLQRDMPGFATQQAAILIKSLRDPNAPDNRIALALEQLGRPIIPMLRLHYNSPQSAVRFFTVLAGSFIGDEDAIPVLAKYATDSKSPFQRTAIRDLARCGDRVNATLAYSKLLRSNDPGLKILAYRGLAEIHSSHLYRQPFFGRFLMSVLPADTSSLVYVTSHRLPQIAIIGHVPVLVPGTLYISPRGALTINYPLPASGAAAGKSAFPVMLYYRDPLTHKVVELTCKPQLPAIISALAAAPDPFSPKFNPKTPYIAISYQRLVTMLYTLCQTGEINATFRLERMANRSREMFASLNQPRPSHSTMNLATTTTQNVKSSGNGSLTYSTSLPGEVPGK
jgi:flagellar basal body P-ring protein FlgI